MSNQVSKRTLKKVLHNLYEDILKHENHVSFRAEFCEITHKELKEIKENYNFDFIMDNYQEKLGIIPNSTWYDGYYDEYDDDFDVAYNIDDDIEDMQNSYYSDHSEEDYNLYE